MLHMNSLFLGRIDRTQWFLGILVLVLPLPFLAAIDNSTINVLFPFIVVVVYALSISLHIRRMHDINRSGAYFLLSFIPFVNFYYLYLLFQVGNERANTYGEPPTKRGVFSIVFNTKSTREYKKGANLLIEKFQKENRSEIKAIILLMIGIGLWVWGDLIDNPKLTGVDIAVGTLKWVIDMFDPVEWANVANYWSNPANVFLVLLGWAFVIGAVCVYRQGNTVEVMMSAREAMSDTAPAVAFSNATVSASKIESNNNFATDAWRYFYDLVTEDTENRAFYFGYNTVSWKSVVFPSIIFLFLLHGGIGGWVPFIAAVVALAFVQIKITRALIDDLINRSVKQMANRQSGVAGVGAAKKPSDGIALMLGATLLMYIIGLGFVFAFLVPGVCGVQGWANTQFLPKKVCTAAHNGLDEFLQSNNGGQYR